MPTCPDASAIPIVTACMNADGTPDFAWTEVTVTQEQAENGLHYTLAEAQLVQRGYEEPFVHFDAQESPDFLHEAVRQYLGLAPASTNPTPIVLTKER
jgi:hypothetical protein